MTKSLARAIDAIGAALLLAALPTVGPGCAKGPASGHGQVGTVAKGDVIQRVTVSGVIVPQRRTVILPPYSGYIRKIHVGVGEKVQAGQPVVSLVQSLADRGEVYPLRAPFAGTVVQVLHSDGEYVEEKSEQSTLVRIDDLQRLFVMVDVPELDLVKIREGQQVLVRASAILGRTFKGVIRDISLAAREKKEWSRSSDKVEFPVRIELVERSPEVRPGMSAIVDVIADKREGVLTIGQEFVQRQGQSYFAVLESGERRDIEVGLQNEEVFEVRSGLKAGDRVRQTDFLALSAGS